MEKARLNLNSGYFLNALKYRGNFLFYFSTPLFSVDNVSFNALI